MGGKQFILSDDFDWPVKQGPIPGFADEVLPGFREFTRKNIRTLWAFRRAVPWNWGDATEGP